MNMVSDSSTGSAPSAEKPRNATTASDGILPPAAWPSRRISRVVSAMANSDMNTGARKTGEFLQQRAVEDHAILVKFTGEIQWNLA